MLSILRVLRQKLSWINHRLNTELMTENFLLMILILIDILSITLRLTHIDDNYNKWSDKITKTYCYERMQNLKKLFMRSKGRCLIFLCKHYQLFMNKVIPIILFAALLLGSQCQYYGWFDWQPCHYSCDYCWYGYDPNYCQYCAGNRLTVNNYFWYYSCPCDTGYYDDGNAWCPQCSYQCATCHSTANTCDSCNGAHRLYTPACDCASTFYDNGTPNCLPCHYSCNTCSSSSSCDTCNSGYQRYFVSGSSYCGCAARYYDPGSIKCLACDPTCLSCSGTASNNCLTCNINAFRVLSSTSCVCMTGYYATSSTVQQCSACLYSCLTCASSASNCLSCNANLQRSLVSASCPCIAGYFENSSRLCQPCSHQCATCVTSSTNCLTCNPNRVSAPTCACLPQYYDDGTTAACIRCQYSCGSCSSLTKCDTCNSSYQRSFTQVSTFCVCPDRYYDPTSEPCVACDPTCFRCSSSASNACTACNAAASRVLSSGSCVCKTGYYATSSSVEQCATCLYSCLTCSVAANNCTTCNSTLNRVLTVNTCPCAPTYFQNSSLLCDTCQSSCATCTSKLACVTCFAAQLTVINSTGFCSCAAGKYWSTNICLACTYFCLTCTGTASNCTSCPASTNRVYNSNSCSCIAGFYDNSAAVCLACSYTCQTCTTGTTTGCTSCDSSKKRDLSGGACPCAIGYFDDGSNAACQQCNYKCLTCSVSTSCLTCSATLFRSYSSTTSLCECYSNYYESNSKCYACMSTCLTCTNGVTCTTCDATLNRFLNTTLYTCDCSPGYYVNSSGLCAPCNSLCTTCNSGTTCLTCKPNLNRTFNSNSSTCDCLTGYILISASNVCLTCQITCLTCVTNYTNRCQTCDNSTSRLLNSTNYQCQCPIGYFDDGVHAACGVCSYTCLTCSNTNVCLSCPTGSNRVYDSVQHTCYCAQHYYDKNVTFSQNATCGSCLYYCSTCIQSTSCVSCNATNFRVFNATNSKCLCLGGYYDDGSHQLCATCSYKCYTCTNSSACLACNSSWNRDTPSSLCPCSIGFYDNSSPTCLACHYSCLTCTNGTQCATCQGLYNRKYNSTTKLCSCTAGYYDPGTPVCLLCSYSCLTCVTSGSHCLTCNTTVQRALNTSTFSCPCNNGFYDNAALVCLPCNYTCSTCGNNRSCLTCNLTRFRTINSITGLCACITSYYDNNLTQTCLACQATCLTCINSTKCTSCDANRNRVLNYTADYANFSDPFCPCFYKYYSLGTNSSCSPCHFSCSYCSASSDKNCLYCNSASHRKLQKSGQCTCIDGFYDTNATQPCPSCNVACLTCWNNLTTTCFTCNSSNFMMVGANTCYVNCPTYYFNNVSAMICTLCQAHCLVCLNSTNCTQCEAPMFLFNSSCEPKCLLGYYGNSTTHSCQLCKPGCANCSTSTNCFKCVNSSYYVDQSTTLCELCSTTCLTCFGPTQNNCLNCTYPLYLNSQYMCVNLTCSYGKYLDTFKGCVSCNTLFSHSITCNISEAFLCEKSYLLQNGKCVGCNSVKGYALDIYNQCNQICGDGILIYYQCDDGNTYNGDGCSANCIIENGWKCSTLKGKSICKLNSTVDISFKKAIKFARKNTIRVTLGLSLPLRLTNQNFLVKFLNLSSSDYDYDVLDQDQTDLTEVSIDINYEKNIQHEQVQLSYSQSRRLQQIEEDYAHRLLQTVTFSSSFNVTSFPPANYITQTTYTYYDVTSSVIFYLSIVLTLLNLIIVPKRYALHSLTFSWIVPYLYLILFYSTSYTTQWVSSIATRLKYAAVYWGFSLGQCCVRDSIQSTTTEIFDNVGGILLGLLVTWGVFLILSFFNLQIEAQLLLKINRMLKYYLLTAHLYFLAQITYAAANGIYYYSLLNRIDAVNITLSIFLLIGSAFFVISLWYITCISKFDGSFDQMSSKAATRHTIEKQQSKHTEQNDSNIVINLSNVKEMSRYQSTQFNISSSAYLSSNNFNQNGTHGSGFTIESRSKTQESQEEMGEQESFFPYDYCYLYNNANKRSKYFLPMLMTKLFLFAFFGVTLTKSPFAMAIMHLLFSLIFLVYFCGSRPFQSKFTVARIIIVELMVIIIQGMFTVYQYFALSYVYIEQLQFYLVLAIIILLSFVIIFMIIEQYRIWRESIAKCCENCCLSFRLSGKSYRVDHTAKDTQNRQNIIKVETVQEGEMGEVDAFYARMLQKQALNNQYKKERMIHDAQFEKSFM